MDDSLPAPPVSVLICVYNGENYLAATIDSVLAQTHQDFELIVVDDGSTDGSAKVLERYHDRRVKVFRQENQGAAAALRAALEVAKGACIAFLDQDDLWEEEKLAVHLDVLRLRPEIDLTFSWFQVIDHTGRKIGIHSARHQGTADFQGLLTDFVIGATSNVVVRRAAIDKAGGIDRTLPRLYDLDLFLRIARLSPRNIEAIPRDLMQYRRHAGQISRDIEALKQEWARALEKLRGIAPAEVKEVEPKARSNMSRYFARIAYEDAKFRAGLELLREGFRYAPSTFLADPRNWLTAAACLSGLLLPPRLHRQLEQIAGLRRN